MNWIDKIFLRSNIRQLCSFLMDGADLDKRYEDDRPFKQRIEEEERPIWRLLEKTFSDKKELDEAADKLSSALVVNQHVFMEIGIRAGASLMLDLLRENPHGGRP